MLHLCIIGDTINDQIQIEADCMIANLQMDECRAGCPNCALDELASKLDTTIANMAYDQGLF